MKFTIRQEIEADYLITEQVIKKAFETAEMTDHNEHHLVARLRKSDAFIPPFSLVATHSATNEILGHILLTKISIQDENQNHDSLALAPVSVLPEYQQNGIGQGLIKAAIEAAKNAGHQSVIVLGHPAYYPKFGFKPSTHWNIKTPFEVPEEALMALELQDGALKDVSGIIVYSQAFFE